MIIHSCETSKLLGIYYNFVSVLIDTSTVAMHKVLFIVLFVKILITYLLTPWSRVLFEKLISKLCR